MLNNSLIFNSLNKLLTYSQEKCKYLSENSFFLKNIDNFIFATIIGVIFCSTFASSDTIGYIGLITLFLSIFKLFVKSGEKIEGNLFEIFLLIFFLIVIISVAGSSELYLSFKGFLKTLTYLGFYFSAALYFKNNLSKIPITIGLIAACASAQGIVGIFQNFSQVGEISTWQDVSNLNPEEVMTRVYGTLQPFNPNLFGGYMVAAIPCLFGLISLNITEKRNNFAFIAFLFTAITSFSLILSGCRGAYIGLLSILACVFFLLAKYIWKSGKERLKRAFLSVLGSIIALGVAIVLFVSSIRARVFSIFAMREDSSTSFRFNVYQSALQMAKDNWLLGIGVGNQNFREIYGLYMRTGFDALSAYCVFLEISVESGIFALIAFLCFIGSLIYLSIKFILRDKDLKSTILISTALISIIAVMVHGFVDTVFFRPQIQFIFWTMVAFVSAILKNENAR